MSRPGNYVHGTVALNSTSSDPGGSGVASSHFEISPDGTTWTSIPASFDTTVATDGLYDFRVVAVDNAANTGTSTPLSNIRIDNTKPVVSVTSPAPSASVGGTVNLTASVTDADPTPALVFEVSPHGAGTWQAVNASWHTKPGPD